MTSEDGLIVFIDGVYQADNVYSVSGTTLTFATAPVNSRIIEVFQLEGGIVGSAPVVDTMTGDGSDTTLTLSVSPISENQTFVTFDGVVQHKSTYSVSGNTLTFATAPVSGVAVECITFTNVTAATDSVVDTFSGTGSQTAFTLSRQPLTENNTLVYVSGIYQDKSTYSVSGTTLTFSTAPANGVSIEVVSAVAAITNSATLLVDADSDTKIQVEESSDEDKIRFDTGGTERMMLDDSGRLLIGQDSGDAFNSDSMLRLQRTGDRVFMQFKTDADQNSGILFGDVDDDVECAIEYEPANKALTLSTGNNAEAMRIDSSGNVGISTSSPAYKLDIQDTSDPAQIRIKEDGNTNGFIFKNYNGNEAQLVNADNGPMVFKTNNTEAMRINSSGNLLINSTTDNTGVSGGGIRQEIDSGETDGDKYYVAQGGGSNATPFVLEVVSQNLYDSGTTAMKVGRHSGNQRSISAGGTLNASGADYAEYMKKTDSCGTIAKGDVVGVDANGKLTKTFSDSINFVIKSTDPSYVGGDTWGSVDLNLTKEQYETERQKYDRIAFSGQVPVNITGSFNVGDYVYPQANGTDIECVAKSTPTFEEYQLCVGKIWATEDDGRPLVAVKIG
jgi:hypothetical protein